MATPRWRRFWDWSFFGSSLLAALLFGVAVGNAIVGIPLTSRGIYAGTFFDLLGYYPLLVGVMTVSLFAMHGAIYLYLKTESPLQDRVRGWMWHSFGIFLVLYLFTTIVTLIQVPRATENLGHMPWLWGVVLLSVLAIANIPRAVFVGRPGQAFLSSCLTIACLVTLFAAALFPNMVTNSAADGISLTLYNASASGKTLGIMLIMALIGMPMVIAYTTVVYWTFRGKVVIDRHSY
jgi:cytochrome d ubiquinol oxidase subunit II